MAGKGVLALVAAGMIGALALGLVGREWQSASAVGMAAVSAGTAGWARYHGTSPRTRC